jgi:phosphatidylglycerol lysyltransferase
MTTAAAVPPSDTLDRARAMVLRHGHNPTAYQTLNPVRPGFRYFFSRTLDAFTAYVPCRPATWVTAGAPVCETADLPAAMAEFEAAAAADGCAVCYTCATERLRTLLSHSPNHSMITLGAEPVWNPQTWPDLVKRERSIRSQINRARNKHVTATQRPAADARTDPALRRVLGEWLGTKSLPPMQFLNSSDPAAGPLDDRLLFTATHDGHPVAFLLASPVPGRNGHLVEQLARVPRAPNGTAELLIDYALRVLADAGHTYVTLGLVPLSSHAPLDHNPMWLRPLIAWARAHSRRFYNFDGLESFRTKLHPDRWEPLYAVANRPTFPPTALYAMGAATFGASPVPVFARALAAAAGQEFRRLLPSRS